MHSNFVQVFEKYIHDWNTTRSEYRNWKCRLPIIGVFFEIRVSNKLGKITKEYERYLSTPLSLDSQSSTC
jgi:hypothetical protein